MQYAPLTGCTGSFYLLSCYQRCFNKGLVILYFFCALHVLFYTYSNYLWNATQILLRIRDFLSVCFALFF